nr:hypothetical protein [Micromonospora echinaurantiaca]
MILPPLPRRQPVCGLLPAMRAEEGEGLRRHRNRPPGPLRLGRHELEATLCPLHGLPNGQRAGIEVDIRPGEPEQLPATKAHRQSADVQGFQAVTPQHIEQPLSLVHAQGATLDLPHGRRADRLGGVAVHQLLPLRVTE